MNSNHSINEINDAINKLIRQRKSKIRLELHQGEDFNSGKVQIRTTIYFPKIEGNGEYSYTLYTDYFKDELECLKTLNSIYTLFE